MVIFLLIQCISYHSFSFYHNFSNNVRNSSLLIPMIRKLLRRTYSGTGSTWVWTMAGRVMPAFIHASWPPFVLTLDKPSNNMMALNSLIETFERFLILSWGFLPEQPLFHSRCFHVSVSSFQAFSSAPQKSEAAFAVSATSIRVQADRRAKCCFQRNIRYKAGTSHKSCRQPH